MNDSFDLRQFLSDNPDLRASMRRTHLRMGVKIALILAAAAGLTAAMVIRYGMGLLPFGPAVGILLILWQKPWRVFGSTRVGTIEEIRYELRRESNTKNPADRRYTSMETRNYIKCFCSDGKGKRFAFLVDQRYEAVYRPGDLAVKLSGLPYPANLTPGEQTVCPVCGQIGPAENLTCTGCGRDGVKL